MALTDEQLKLFVEEEIRDTAKDVSYLTWFETYDLDDEEAERADWLLRKARVIVEWPNV